MVDGKQARELNALVRYTMWSVFRVARRLDDADRAAYAAELTELFDQLAQKGVEVRGTYDVSGLRADADLMVWTVAPTSDDLQDAYQRIRRTALGRHLEPVWSVMALHRPAEFNKSHVPAFLAGEAGARIRLRLPVRAVLRVVPAAGRRAPATCSPSTGRWRATTRTCAPTP